MGRQFVVLLLISLASLSLCESSNSLRNLNRKFNLLKENVDRDLSKLQFAVVDLQTELELEKGRTSELEALLNNTTSHSAETYDQSPVKSLKNQIAEQDKIIANLRGDIKAMERENTDAENLKEIVESQAKELSDTKHAVQFLSGKLEEIKENINLKASTLNKDVSELGGALENKVMTSLTVITRAFSTEKTKLREFFNHEKNACPIKSETDLEILVVKALNDSVMKPLREMNQSFDYIIKEMHTLLDKVNEIKKQQSVNSEKISVDAAVHKNQNVSQEVCAPTTDPKDSFTIYALYGDDFCNNFRKCSRVFVVSEGRSASVTEIQLPNMFLDLEGDGKTTRFSCHSKNFYIITGGNDEHLEQKGVMRFKPIFGKNLESAITIGSRVLRGADWSWGDQDGGGPGTVTGWYANDRSTQQVYVKWDNKGRANYRLGAYGKYDLFLLADDYDEHLEQKGVMRFKPIFGKNLESAITIGSRVLRGADWSWGDQDGGGPGTVTGWYSNDKSTQLVLVKWDNRNRSNYRVGAYGKYDLFLLADDY